MFVPLGIEYPVPLATDDVDTLARELPFPFGELALLLLKDVEPVRTAFEYGWGFSNRCGKSHPVDTVFRRHVDAIDERVLYQHLNCVTFCRQFFATGIDVQVLDVRILFTQTDNKVIQGVVTQQQRFTSSKAHGIDRLQPLNGDNWYLLDVVELVAAQRTVVSASVGDE